MSLQPIVSALAIGFAVWLLATAILWSAIPPDEDVPLVLVILTFLAGIIAAFSYYRFRVGPRD